MRALISVSDKKGSEKLAKTLVEKGVEIISTGGTAKYLRSHGIKVTDVSSITDFPEILEGRVKTLHPKIFGGILARRTADRAGRDNDSAELKKHHIEGIDWVIVNLYPFEKTAAEVFKNGNFKNGKLKTAELEQKLLENIDVGGVSLLRAAAKNYRGVIVICDPNDYDNILKKFEAGCKNGYADIDIETRRKLGRKAFELTSHYDDVIANVFRKMLGEPETLDLHYKKVSKLRYGENPHQRAAFFRNPLNKDSNVTNAKLLSRGKELSFNNILDTDSAFELCKEFERPTVVFVKHNNPCGVASAEKIGQAFALSHKVDPLSAYGAVVALNREVNEEITDYIFGNKLFIEVIIAPKFSKGALQKLLEKPNLRILETGALKRDTERRDIRKVAGGLLVETANTYIVSEKDLKIVSKKKPSSAEVRAMLFANKIVKHVMSNAIVLVKSVGAYEVVTGIGAGQMSRVDSVFMACRKAGKQAKGSAMASDAFFPFPDAVEEAAKHGISAVIQPGGSIRDDLIVDTVNKRKIAMVFTGIRLFRH